MTSGRRSSTSVRNSSRRRASPSTVTCSRSVGCCAGLAFGAAGRRAAVDRERRAGGSPWAPSASPSGTWTTCVGGVGTAGSVRIEPLSPVRFRTPVGVRRFANGSTTSESGRAARSVADTPSPNAPSNASSYSSTASVAAHQIRVCSSPLRTWSQWPPGCGRRSPSGVSRSARTRLGIEVGVAPT